MALRDRQLLVQYDRVKKSGRSELVPDTFATDNSRPFSCSYRPFSCSYRQFSCSHPLSDSMKPDTVHRTVLPNGLTVLIQEAHYAPVVAIVTYVKAGYFDETD